MIKAELLSNEKSVVTVDIKVEEETVLEHLKAAVQKINKQVTIPGFRKGKATRTMIERYVGKDAIYEETIKSLIPQAYYDAMKQLDLRPVADPEFDKLDQIQFETGMGISFQAVVTVEPEGKLPDYENLKLDREEKEVTEADIDAEIEAARQQKAQFVPTDRQEVIDGDFITLDFAGYMDGKQFDGGTATDAPLLIGSHYFIPGFEEQVVGAKIGEEKEITVTFPENYQPEHFAGKDAIFKITVKSIKAKELPEVTDEFAKEIANVESVVALRDRIKHNLFHRMQSLAVRDLGVRALRKIVEDTEVEIPDLLIEAEIDKNVDRLKNRVAEEGLTWEKYLESVEKSDDDIREKLRETAPEAAKVKLVVTNLVRKHELYPTVIEVNRAVAQMISGYEFESPEARENVMKDENVRMQAAEEVGNEKVLAFLGTKCDSTPLTECEECKAVREKIEAAEAAKKEEGCEHKDCDCGHNHDHAE